jgi:hypothetical protein
MSTRYPPPPPPPPPPTLRVESQPFGGLEGDGAGESERARERERGGGSAVNVRPPLLDAVGHQM